MDQVKQIGAAEALERVSSSAAILLDVREQDEWDRGHSPSAVLLPMSALPARIGEIPTDTPLLVVCHSGQRSARVTRELTDAGFDAANVSGGMIAWQSAGGEIVAAAGSDPRVD